MDRSNMGISESLLREGYMRNALRPYIFIKWSQNSYEIIVDILMI